MDLTKRIFGRKGVKYFASPFSSTRHSCTWIHYPLPKKNREFCGLLGCPTNSLSIHIRLIIMIVDAKQNVSELYSKVTQLC